VSTTTNFIATNGLPEKQETDKDDCSRSNLYSRQQNMQLQADVKRKQSNVRSDNVRLAARRMTRTASSLPNTTRRKFANVLLSNAMTRFRNVRSFLWALSNAKTLFSN